MAFCEDFKQSVMTLNDFVEKTVYNPRSSLKKRTHLKILYRDLVEWRSESVQMAETTSTIFETNAMTYIVLSSSVFCINLFEFHLVFIANVIFSQ